MEAKRKMRKCWLQRLTTHQQKKRQAVEQVYRYRYLRKEILKIIISIWPCIICRLFFHLLDGRLSFPSGHASSALYFFTYWIIYLQARMIPEVFGDTLLRPFLQLAGALAAILVALSRVSDYKHHWSDVFAGSILGLVVAILVAVFVSDLLRIPVSKDSRIEKGEVMPLNGSGSAISDQLSSDSKDHANNVVTAIA